MGRRRRMIRRNWRAIVFYALSLLIVLSMVLGFVLIAAPPR